MLSNFRDVLVLAPHTDDGELGAGGTISKLIESGAKVTYVAFSTAEDSVPDGLPKDILKKEVVKATAKLGIKPENLIILNYQVRRFNYDRQQILEDLISLRKESSFDLILTPSVHDIHQDHATISQESTRAFKNTTILGYELIWNNLTFNTQCFVKLEEKHIEAKQKALEQYESQGKRNYLARDFTFSLAKTRGVQVGTDYAECFEVIRIFL
ncbi:PIG-L deacetylase family protein [Pseudoalteromonas lipolytica]|uniref:LmbE family protein n=1 Tax=Pseudoalteromonas lipolytica TaxID=570156 RepID=A0A0P7DSP9_9GAMM|nr:PIG-L deacetylase family protein [Pseudoalteromonas lipolytica]KPM84277.1 LmbE family protein [Pseudoalteromonas lipolytica]